MTRERMSEKAKEFTAIGAAVLMAVALIGGAFAAVTRTYAFAQQVEVYISLPSWLEKVEKKVDAVAVDSKATKEAVEALVRAEERRARREGRRWETNGGR